MNVEHFDAQPGSFDAGLGNGIGNIVEFKIEKDFAAELLNQTYRLRPGRGKQLFSDFEHADLGSKEFDQLLDLFKIADIEGNDEPLSHGTARTHQLEVGGHNLCSDGA
jgi:hypothetical protein